MKNKLHFIPLFVIAIAALIVGSFLDLSIARGIYAGSNNWFTILFSVIGALSLCGIITYLGFLMALRNIIVTEKIWRWIVIFVAVCGIAFSSYYFGSTMITEFLAEGVIPNESWAKATTAVVADVLMVGVAFLLAWYTRKKVDDEAFLKSAAGIVVIAGVGCVAFFLIKIFMPRLRYRSILALPFSEDYGFTQWWKPISSETKELLLKIVNKEEIRSFPSGHSLCSCYCVLAVPFIARMFKGSEKACTIALYSSFVFAIITGLSRMCGGAHFLSDTSFSMILMLCLLFIYNEYELAIRFPKPKKEKETN